MSGDGLDLLKPFLPGLEAALDDPDVSEIMINGPGNVWLEGHGRLRPIDAPALDAAALERAAIHIARPLGLDPATTPILDARLGDGSRVAICVPPASPSVAITVRRFGKRSFSAAQLVAQGALPAHIRDEAERVLHTRRNILVSGGTGSGKTTLLNASLHSSPTTSGSSPSRTPWSYASTPRTASGSRRGGYNRGPSVSATSCATPCGTDPITSSSAKCAAAKRPTCCKPSTPDTADHLPRSTPTTPRAPSHDWRAVRCRAGAICRGT